MNWPLQRPSFKRRSEYSSYSSSEPEYSSPYSWKYFLQRGSEIHCYLCPFYLLKWHWKDQNRASLETILFSTLLLGNCHLGLRTRSRFRTLILNNPKFYHCCTSWSLPEVSFFLQMKYFGFHPLLLLLIILTKPKPPPRHWEAPRLTRRRSENIKIEEAVGICANMKTFKC